MELPDDIWESILMKSKDKDSCEKLYNALSLKTQKLLEPSYNNALDYFRDIYLIIVQDIIIIFKDDEQFRVKKFSKNIRCAELFRFYNSAIILFENNELFYYNYCDNVEYPIEIPNNYLTNDKIIIFLKLNWYKDNFYLLVANNYELNFAKYIDEIPQYLQNIHKANRLGKKKYHIEINNVSNEIATFVYYKENNNEVYDLKLINHVSGEVLFNSNLYKIRSMCFSEYDEFFFCENYKIYKYDENEEKLFGYIYGNRAIFKLDKLIAFDKYFFYSIFYDNKSEIYNMYYGDDLIDNENFFKILTIENRVNYLEIHNKGEYLIIGTIYELIFYSFIEKKVTRRVDIDYLMDKSEIVKHIDLDDNIDMRFDLLLR